MMLLLRQIKVLNALLIVNIEDLSPYLMCEKYHWATFLVDFKKAFLQISIQKQDRGVTQFLWFHNPNCSEKVEENLDIISFTMFHLELYEVHFCLKELY